MRTHKLMLPILAVIVGIAASAFTTINAQRPTSQEWFTYNTGASDPSINTNYSLAPGSGADPQCPTAPANVCSVLADPDQNNANIPDQSELTNLDNQSQQFTKQNPSIEYKH